MPAVAKVYVETPEAYTDEEKEALLELIPEKILWIINIDR